MSFSFFIFFVFVFYFFCRLKLHIPSVAGAYVAQSDIEWNTTKYSSDSKTQIRLDPPVKWRHSEYSQKY
jgi:hypothetical protein